MRALDTPVRDGDHGVAHNEPVTASGVNGAGERAGTQGVGQPIGHR